MVTDRNPAHVANRNFIDLQMDHDPASDVSYSDGSVFPGAAMLPKETTIQMTVHTGTAVITIRAGGIDPIPVLDEIRERLCFMRKKAQCPACQRFHWADEAHICQPDRGDDE